jgi:hypothetical protein
MFFLAAGNQAERRAQRSLPANTRQQRGGILAWAGVVALLAIGAGAVFGFELGTFFSVAMVALAGGSILYDTSNVMLHYPEDRHVAAALELFASVALMFWYVLRLFLSRRD